MDQNNLFRQRIDEYQSKVGEEVEWWTRRRAEIQEGFMKELDAEKGVTTTTPAAPVVTPAAAATPLKSEPAAAAAPPSVTAVSDDDGVLVEAEVPKVNSGTSSVKKKKKGKK